jgi:carbamoyl-phosphate synthase large subunit
MTKKILFVGGGRRVSLAERFHGYGFTVEAYENDCVSPISQMCKTHIGRSWENSAIEYDLVKNYIDNGYYLLPLHDMAVILLAEIKKLYPDRTNQVIVSSPEVANICTNKLLLEQFMMKNFPDLYPNLDCDGYIIKPIIGYGSKDLTINKTPQYSHNYIAQKLIVGTEYTVDAYFDKQCKMIDAVPRIRLRVGDGEVIDSITENNLRLIDITKKIGEKLNGLNGPVCFQYIMDGKTAEIFLTEINARFGGGVILSLEAGLNIIKWIEAEYFDNTPIACTSGQWKHGLLMRRVSREFFFDGTV